MNTSNCLICSAFTKSTFCKLEKNNLITVSDNSVSFNFLKGQNIFNEGTRASGVFCISKGKVKLYKTDSQGRSIIIDFATDGMMIGTCAIFNNNKYILSASCIEDTSLCFIPQKTIIEILDRDVSLMSQINQKICLEKDRITTKLANTKFKNIRENIAMAIIDLHKDFSIDEHGYIDVSLTKEEIAQIAGTTTPSAIRLTNEFVRDKIIKIHHRKIKILNQALLFKAAGEKL